MRVFKPRPGVARLLGGSVKGEHVERRKLAILWLGGWFSVIEALDMNAGARKILPDFAFDKLNIVDTFWAFAFKPDGAGKRDIAVR